MNGKSFYIVGLCASILACLLCLFGSCFSMEYWEYGNIENVGSVYNETRTDAVSLMGLYGDFSFVLVLMLLGFEVFIIIVAIKFLKANDFSSAGYLMFGFFAPAIIIFATYLGHMGEASFIGGEYVTYGSGSSLSISGTGVFSIILCVIAFVLVCMSLGMMENNGKTKINDSKKKEKKYIADDDFSV